MPPRPLPTVHSLQEACREVRDQPQGKRAIKFVSMKQDTYDRKDPELRLFDLHCDCVHSHL